MTWSNGWPVFMSGFEVEDGAGATTISHILNASPGGGNEPTRNTTTPLTGAADLKWTKAAGVAMATNYYRYLSSVISAAYCLSATFRIQWNTLPATNGNGYALLGYDLDGTGVGVYRTGGSSYIALWHKNNTLAWNGASALSASPTKYFVTYTSRNGGNQTATKNWLGMVILRDSTGTEIERSPWVRMEPNATSPTQINSVAIGGIAANSAWTELAEYQMDDLIVVNGGVHAPKFCSVSLVRPTGEGVNSRRRSGTAVSYSAGTPSVTIAGNFTTDVGYYVYYGTQGRRITAAVYSSPNTTYTLSGTLDADPTGNTIYVYGAGDDTDDNGVLWDEVDEPAADDVTSQIKHFGTTGKAVGFVHGGITDLGTDGIITQMWARGKVTVVGTGTPVWSARWWDGASVGGTAGANTSTSWAWGTVTPTPRRSGFNQWTVATVNAAEIGTARTSGGNSSTEVDISYIAMEVAQIDEWDDTYESGVTMREINHLTSDRRMLRTHREPVE